MPQTCSLTQQMFTVSQFRKLEIPDQGLAGWVSGEDSSSSADGHLVTVSSHGRDSKQGLRVQEVRHLHLPSPLHSWSPGSSMQSSPESEPPPQLSLPVAITSDPQIPRITECSRKESLNLSVHPKHVLNKDHILHMSVCRKRH